MISPPRARVATKRSRANASQPANPCRPHRALSHVTGTMYCPETSRSPASAASPPAPRQPRKRTSRRGRTRWRFPPARSAGRSPPRRVREPSPTAMLRTCALPLGPPGTCPLAPCALPPLESETAKRRSTWLHPPLTGASQCHHGGQVHGAERSCVVRIGRHGRVWLFLQVLVIAPALFSDW